MISHMLNPTACTTTDKQRTEDAVTCNDMVANSVSFYIPATFVRVNNSLSPGVHNHEEMHNGDQ